MNNIISAEQIKQCSFRITCASEQGTGFLVGENLLMTARHVIVDVWDGNDIIINGGNYTIVSIVAENATLDLCIIRLDFNSSVFLPLVSSSISYNLNCSIFGFPYTQDSTGSFFDGRVDKVGVERHWDFSVKCVDVEEDIDYSGLSGGAIVSNHKVVGIALIQKEKSVCSISVRKAVDFLLEAQVNVEKAESSNEIPKQLKDDVDSSTPNYSVFENLTNKLEEYNGWFLCHGSPGSGKTTFMASYVPDENVNVVGRYFTKIPNDDLSQVIRTSNRRLLSWVEDSIGHSLGVTIDYLDKTEERVKRVPFLINQLAQHFGDEKCVFLIDGLDEVLDVESFLGIFPENLPSNISIVLSCTSIDILPTRIKNLIEKEKIIEVTPLDIGQCETYIRENLKGKEIGIESIQKIATKSEGHPLYLQYLISFLRNNDIDSEQLEVWIDEIPTIGGEIGKYYEMIWAKFFKEENKLWIVLTLSQLRNFVSQEEFITMLPSQYRLGFYSHFSPISYLLKDSLHLELYHASFKNFITSKVPIFVPIANDNISEFNLNNPQSRYSIDNKLYHIALGSTPEQSITQCTQDWADFCAFNHVTPDLVIQDIKKVIGLAVKNNDANEVIRLLLLLQRIEFRYDSVFAENASYLVSALIAIGEFSFAIKYLVRDNTLLLNDDMVVYFLQLFYENGAAEEGDALFKAFESRFRKYLNEFGKEDYVSLEPFIYRVRALTASLKSIGEDNKYLIQGTINALSNLQSSSKKEGNMAAFESVYNVRQEAISWHSAYLLRNYDLFLSSEQLSQNGASLDNKWASMRARIVDHFNGLNTYATKKIEKSDKYYQAIADIEWLVDNHGYEENKEELYYLIKALIYDSLRIDILNKLALKFLEYVPDLSTVREPNGVDVDFRGMHLFYFKQLCNGYINLDEVLSEIPDSTPARKSWEGFLIEVIKQLGLLEGLLIKRSKQGEGLSDLLIRLQNITHQLNFSLKERSGWERVYLVPEDVIPFIYGKISQLFCAFYSSSLDWFVKYISKNKTKQLGIYTEGYRMCLATVINILIKNRVDNVYALQLVEILEIHVVQNIHNRWERTLELIKIVEFYGLLGNKEKAMLTFQEMLKTSMGPTWYKESQLQLLNTAFGTNLGSEGTDDNILKIVSLLDYASGEMTFQRYIRNAKENFVGDIISKGCIDKAIEYLKFEAIPPVDILIQNAEYYKLDSLELGYGNAQGARNVAIQNGILQILISCKEIQPAIKAALCYIFTINDDTFRYIDGFAKQMSLALNEMHDTQRSLVFDLIIEIIKSSDLSHDDKRDYMSAFIQNVAPDIYAAFYSYATYINHDLATAIPKPNSEDLKQPTSEESLESDNMFDKFIDKYEKKVTPTDDDALIRLGVEAFKKERISIWYSNWSGSSSKTKQYLKEMFKSPEQTIAALAPFISSNDVEAWIVVDNLIWFLGNKLNEDQAKKFTDDITQHFEMLIRPEKYVDDKYKWLRNVKDLASNNISVVNLIIWLLGHPLLWVNEKSYNAIVFLSKFMPEEITKALIAETISDKSSKSGEICAQLLLDITSESPHVIVKVLSEEPQLLNAISNIDHLTIFKIYFDVARALAVHSYTDLQDVMNDKLPKAIASGSEVEFTDEIISPMYDEIEGLSEMGILNRQFCENTLDLIHKECNPLSWKDWAKSDQYLWRSYYDAELYDGRYAQVVRYAINKSIMARVNGENIDEIYEIINMSNV